MYKILVVTAIGRWPHPTDRLVSRRVIVSSFRKKLYPSCGKAENSCTVLDFTTVMQVGTGLRKYLSVRLTQVFLGKKNPGYTSTLQQGEHTIYDQPKHKISQRIGLSTLGKRFNHLPTSSVRFPPIRKAHNFKQIQVSWVFHRW